MSGGNKDGRTALLLGEALRLVIEAAPSPVAERVRLEDSLGRVLAEEARARIDQPPFDKSAMDGFAHASALPAPEGPWRIVGLAAARAATASEAPLPLAPGECVRIMTGAMVPPGATAVQRVEWTESEAGNGAGVRFTRPEKWDNIIRRGENQKTGDLLLSPRLLGPQDIGLLASSGYGEILATRRPRVALISTGDELAAAIPPRSASPGVDTLPPGAIYDSNGPQLTAMALSCGCEAQFLGIVRDDEDALAAAFSDALDDCDVLVISGGVSMGEFDHVPRALARAGIETVFHGLALRPGKPLFFGTRRTGARRGSGPGASTGAGGRAAPSAFGLPGNPVSTFVGFELLVRSHLAARAGLRWEPRSVGARLASPLERRETDRTEYLPARLEAGPDGLPTVRPLNYKGSSMLSALAEADCLIALDIGVRRLEEGSVVNARLVRP